MDDLDINESTFSRLSIEIGGEVTVEFEGVKKYFKTQLVGMDAGRYIIIKVPNTLGVHTLAVSGAYLVMRFIGGGFVHGFRCKVISKTTVPAPLLFLTYPTAIKKIPLRKNPRYECLIPARVQCKGYEFEALIIDLSEGGCRLSSKFPDGMDYDDLPVGVDEELTVRFQLPSEDETHGYSCFARHVVAGERKFFVGAQFSAHDREGLQRVRSFIHIVADHRQLS